MNSADVPRMAAEARGGRAVGARSRGATTRDLMSLTRGLVSVWPTTLTFLAGLLATLGLWTLAETYPGAERSRALLAVANGMRQVLELRLNDHLRGLQLAADLWSRFPTRDPNEWKATAQVFLQQHQGLVMIAMLPGVPLEDGTPAVPGSDPAGRAAEALPDTASKDDPSLAASSPGTDPAGTTLFDATPSERPRDALVARQPGAGKWTIGSDLSLRLSTARDGAMTDQRTSIDGPFRAESGQVFYQIVLPLQEPGASRGMLCALLEPAPLLASMISDLAAGYYLSVHDDAALVYEQGTPPRPAAGGAEDRSDSIDLPIQLLMGKTWMLGMERGDLVELPSGLSLGRVALGAGLVFSVLLAGVVHLGQVGRVRARALAIANRELRSQMVSTAVAEGRVRRINESLEARVAERTRALDEVVTELETFNYSVSHDLRSPIGAIVNFTSILAEDYKDRLDQQGLDMLGRVAGCAQNAVAMMDGLLSFSHVGQQTLTLGPVAMRPMVDSVFAEVMLAHSGRPPGYHAGVLPDVVADATMLRMVWTNLLSNAVKFSASVPEPSIEVGCQSGPDEDVFFVRDNGIGFEMKHAARLFNVFEQLHPEARSKGHGVGLAIVSRIVRRHGGRVWAQAAPGKGATFHFSIPKQAP